MFSKTVTTLNIETDSVRLLTVKGRTVREFCEATIPQGFIRNTVIDNPEGVADILSGLFKQAGVSRRRLIVAMNDFRSVSRFITLPRLPRGKMEEAMMWAAEREMPVPLDTLYVTWQVIGKTDSEQRIFLLGTPRETFTQLIKTLWLVDISTKVIESKLISLGRLIKRDKGIVIDLENETISIILQVNGIPAAMQTGIIQQENTVVEDRVKRLTDDLFRVIEFYNKSHPEQTINNDAPVMLTGGIITDDIIELVQESTDRPVISPSISLDIPDDFSLVKYAVNISLILRTMTSERGDTRNSGTRSILRPDMRKAVRFNIQ